MSMNLRIPVFIDPATHRGLGYPKPGLDRKPVRCLIYRDLIASRPEDKQGLFVITRKVNETIDIGDEITVHVREFANGGVKLGRSAPKHMSGSRGGGKVTPLSETKRADKRMDSKCLEGIMHVHHIMAASPVDQAEAATSFADQSSGAAN